MTHRSGRSGNAIVETLLMIPLLTLILAGIYASGNTVSLLSAAESASHDQALRAARRLPDGASNWNSTVAEGEKPFRFEKADGSSDKLLPSPFPSLTGRSIAKVATDRPWDPWTMRSLRLERQRFCREAELSGDCWDDSSGSGRKVRNVVKALAISGVL